MLNGMSVCSLTLWLHAAKPSSVGKTYADQDSTSNRLAFIPFILFPSVSEKAASCSKGGRGGAATNARCSEKKQRQVVSSWGVKKERKHVLSSAKSRRERHL